MRTQWWTQSVSMVLGVMVVTSACGDDSAAPDGDTTSTASSGGSSGTQGTGGSGGAGGETPLAFENLAAQTLHEEQAWSTVIDVAGEPDRVFADDLPVGAVWDEPSRTLRFRPDFLQSGDHEVTLTATRGAQSVSGKLSLNVYDDVSPPLPEVLETTAAGTCQRLVLRQTSDAFLGSPGDVGEIFDAVVIVPEAPDGAAVLVELHGFGGSPNLNAGCSSSFRIISHDPKNTYWWGYADSLPGDVPPTTGAVHDYTQRRVLNLMRWLFENHPGADRDRVFVRGGSMGGAGAMTMGLLHGRHFAGIDATLGQAIPRNHRPGRISQLSTLWGSPETDLPDDESSSTWDRMDLTRALAQDPEATNQFLFIKHGKDDPTIHFGAAVFPSPLTGESLYTALQTHHIGHYAIWDEGAHGPADPVMGEGWWDGGWSRVSDETSFLRRDLPFPAFTSFSEDGDPGDGSGNGNVPLSPSSGYAANVATPGDTGWSGDLAGSFNRFLRWDSTGILDTRDKLELPLRYIDGDGAGAPEPGYPSIDDQYDGSAAPTVSVTPRRVRRFQCLPGEIVDYRFGDVSGSAQANADGSVTIEDLPITSEWTTLVIERAAR